MKKYECLYIVNINYDSEGNSAVITKVEEILKSVGAEVVNSQPWGKRKLAYAIDKERYGNYVLLHFQGDEPKLDDFHRELEIEKGILHYMTIRLDEFPDFDSLSIPQSYESGQRRTPYGSSRKPNQYGDNAGSRDRTEVRSEDAPPSAAPVAEEASEETSEVVTDEAESTEAPVAPEVEELADAEEVTEVEETTDAEEVAEVEEKAETEEVAEVEETVADEVVEEAPEADETAEEEAEKSADAE